MCILGKTLREWDDQNDAGGEFADMLADAYLVGEETCERERMETFEELARTCRETCECPATLMAIHSRGEYDGECPIRGPHCERVKAENWKEASRKRGMLELIGMLECSVLD